MDEISSPIFLPIVIALLASVIFREWYDTTRPPVLPLRPAASSSTILSSRERKTSRRLDETIVKTTEFEFFVQQQDRFRLFFVTATHSQPILNICKQYWTPHDSYGLPERPTSQTHRLGWPYSQMGGTTGGTQRRSGFPINLGKQTHWFVPLSERTPTLYVFLPTCTRLF